MPSHKKDRCNTVISRLANCINRLNTIGRCDRPLFPIRLQKGIWTDD
ncbi:MAG: hypothetical protein JGK01_02585 [Microcoleus sp. PH2017_03_ELD_O_A]|nr:MULTISPECIES: hypothetical protein [unclassified Microcoleus]MCC3411447.1 hypothetical protein [Microcoleus sp. PH2017_02_FOX_O_A]MCC3440705.1 hypothetical protein [Microcoleus sp. PH2017_03_ELD_O_A]MCC3466132.1 hypothetical protein [Microcoleus sp. PH2017_06_SFM_O_A]MCC3436583.1 hypothetical protein [Microcoleus sp. PH2017_05_CCC_O_A]MCC3491400.1 hypothetical protein [Microcoleus sp. PH2017_16_JOR_D_A]